MLDEAHERTVQIDIIMGLLKKILKKREDLRLIISSATVDAEYIRDFFWNPGIENEEVSGGVNKATVLSVEGKCSSNIQTEKFYFRANLIFKVFRKKITKNYNLNFF